MLALVCVRDGALPAGGAETVAECGGRALLAGEGVAEAADALAGVALEVQTWEAGAYAPARWASALAGAVASEDVVVLPGSPDGRDLAPRLAHALGRPLVTGAVRVTATQAETTRWGGRAMEVVELAGPAVVTFEPGVRGVEGDGGTAPAVREVRLDADADAPEPELLEVLAADPSMIDLAEAQRIVAGGHGAGGEAGFALLAEVADALGASLGATRVVADQGLVPFERQIGTTGAVVDPRLYLAFGISGAVQHTAGLGDPRHIVSVNMDGSCPMMQLAHLAVIADAPAVLQALRDELVDA